jgi:hypothetical protein
MDPKALAILGTALSALIAALGYFAKARHERRKTTRIVLYHLLELRQTLAAIWELTSRFPHESVGTLKAALTSNNVALQESDFEEIEVAFKRNFRSFAITKLEEVEREVLQPYARAVADLAMDDPILAFHLKGQASISGTSKAVAQLVGPKPEGMDEGFVDELFALFEDHSRSSSLREISSAIRVVAFEAGSWTYLRVRYMLWRQSRKKPSAEASQALAQVADGVIKIAVAAERRLRETQAPVLQQIQLPPSLR